MNHRHTGLWSLLALGLGALGCQPTHAQTTEPAAPHNGLHSLQAYEDENRLSAGYARWREFGLRGIYQLGDHQLSASGVRVPLLGERHGRGKRQGGEKRDQVAIHFHGRYLLWSGVS